MKLKDHWHLIMLSVNCFAVWNKIGLLIRRGGGGGHTGLVIRAENLVVQQTTTSSKCGCPSDFLIVRMPLHRAAPS